LLAANPVEDADLAGMQLSECHFIKLGRDQLVADERTLHSLFGLLILAHYQTHPSDLLHLLDGSGVDIYAMYWQGKIVATALTLKEGGFDKELAKKIYMGERRPQGHLLPQTLAVHAGFADAPVLKILRIMRIAVHPAVQGVGIGSLLLKNIILKNQNVDCIGSCFGMTPDLFKFWIKQDFKAIHLGFRRDKSSGSHSIVVMLPVSEKGKAFTDHAVKHFSRVFPSLLIEPLKDLGADVVKSLFAKMTGERIVFSEQDKKDLDSFANGKRGYESCIYPLWKFSRKVLSDAFLQKEMSQQETKILIAKVLQKRSWLETGSIAGVSGKKEAISTLRSISRKLLQKTI